MQLSLSFLFDQEKKKKKDFVILVYNYQEIVLLVFFGSLVTYPFSEYFVTKLLSYLFMYIYFVAGILFVILEA